MVISFLKLFKCIVFFNNLLKPPFASLDKSDFKTITNRV